MANEVSFIFDTETNGLGNCSVLSISFIICTDGKIINNDTRYYYAKEAYNYHATKVHGLTVDVIDKKRDECDYSLYFEDDNDWLINVFEEYEVNNIVAHNLSFDAKFLPTKIKDYMEDNTYSTFCTMLQNNKLVVNKKGTGYKMPKLSEACTAYGIEFCENEAHSSDYDTLKAYELFVATIKSR